MHAFFFPVYTVIEHIRVKIGSYFTDGVNEAKEQGVKRVASQ